MKKETKKSLKIHNLYFIGYDNPPCRFLVYGLVQREKKNDRCRTFPFFLST